jgi:hypothetical protein
MHELVRTLDRQLHERHVVSEPRVVDEHGNREAGELVTHGLELVVVGEIRLNYARLHAMFMVQSRRQLFQPCSASCDEHEIPTVTCQPVGVRLPNTGRRACHNRQITHRYPPDAPARGTVSPVTVAILPTPFFSTL